MDAVRNKNSCSINNLPGELSTKVLLRTFKESEKLRTCLVNAIISSWSTIWLSAQFSLLKTSVRFKITKSKSVCSLKIPSYKLCLRFRLATSPNSLLLLRAHSLKLLFTKLKSFCLLLKLCDFNPFCRYMFSSHSSAMSSSLVLSLKTYIIGRNNK